MSGNEGLIAVHAGDWRSTRYPDLVREWRAPRYGDFFRTCWFCGCIHPEDLVSISGWRSDWADRKYGYPHKFYVSGIVNPEPQRLFVIGSTNQRDDPNVGNRGNLIWRAVDELSHAFREVAIAEGYLKEDGSPRSEHTRWLGFGERKELHAKFYTEHYKDTDIDPAVLDAIMERSGLWINWESDGGVKWQRYYARFPEKEPVAVSSGHSDLPLTFVPEPPQA